MALRDGTGGEDLWEKCRDQGVAVICYSGMDFDLSKCGPGELRERMRDAELAASQKNSLETFACKITKGDNIFVKSGPYIVLRGIVRYPRPYRYDSRSQIKDSRGGRWPHTIQVDWKDDFRPVRISVGGPQQPTIRPLSSGDLRRLERADGRPIGKGPQGDLEAEEGQALIAQMTFRSRNRALIEAKKARSDYHCEVCSFSFQERYGPVGRQYIIAHHVDPIGQRKGLSRTRLCDIKLLCANCHAMIHKRKPPFTPDELKTKLR